jgi:hypothetical protein
MKRASAVVAALFAATLACAGFQTTALPNFAHWSAKALREYEQVLHRKAAGPRISPSYRLSACFRGACAAAASNRTPIAAEG